MRFPVAELVRLPAVPLQSHGCLAGSVGCGHFAACGPWGAWVVGFVFLECVLLYVTR